KERGWAHGRSRQADGRKCVEGVIETRVRRGGYVRTKYLTLLRGAAEAAEGEGVPQLLDGRDAVFPDGAGGAGEHVGGARRHVELVHAHRALDVAPKVEEARRTQGDADDGGAENSGVAVPADAGARRVSGDEALLEGTRLDAGPGGDAVAHGQQPVGKGLGRFDGGVLEAVLPAVAAHRAAGGGASHDDRTEIEGLDVRE